MGLRPRTFQLTHTLCFTGVTRLHRYYRCPDFSTGFANTSIPSCRLPPPMCGGPVEISWGKDE